MVRWPCCQEWSGCHGAQLRRGICRFGAVTCLPCALSWAVLDPGRTSSKGSRSRSGADAPATRPCVFSWWPHVAHMPPTTARLPAGGVAVSSSCGCLCGWESRAGGLPSQPCSRALGGQVGWSQAEPAGCWVPARPRGQLPGEAAGRGLGGSGFGACVRAAFALIIRAVRAVDYESRAIRYIPRSCGEIAGYQVEGNSGKTDPW